MKHGYVVTGIVTAVVIIFMVGLGIAGCGSGDKTVKSSDSKSSINEASLSSEAEKQDSGVSQAKVSSSPVSSGTSSGKTAYLSFDDGPSRLTPGLLSILKQNDVHATFFVVAMRSDTAQKRAWMKQEAEDGNTVGLHSWSHDYSYIYANEQNFLTDFNKIRNMIISATGVAPTVMRFPGGIGNTVSIKASGGKIIMPKLVSDVEKMGVTPFDWNAGGEDAVSHVPTKDKVVQDVMNDCKGQDNAVILLHDSENHATSIKAVPEIIKRLKAQGYTFKTLSAQSQKVQETAARFSKYYKHPTVVK